MYAENPFLLEISLQTVKIILLSILAVAMIGLMGPSGYASAHSTETPDHIKEEIETKNNFFGF